MFRTYVRVSRSSSLLDGGVDSTGLNSVGSPLSEGCSKSTIISYVSVVLCLHAAQGCAVELRCGVADSADCNAVVESETISAFTAQDLNVRDRVEVRALIVIGLVPLS